MREHREHHRVFFIQQNSNFAVSAQKIVCGNTLFRISDLAIWHLALPIAYCIPHSHSPSPNKQHYYGLHTTKYKIEIIDTVVTKQQNMEKNYMNILF